MQVYLFYVFYIYREPQRVFIYVFILFLSLRNEEHKQILIPGMAKQSRSICLIPEEINIFSGN